MDAVTPNIGQARAMRVAVKRIEGFAKQFGEAHRNLARHAAFPLVLTPDLLYQIWANFVPEAPWTAVAHVLLSRLCRQVGYEIYEMDIADRNLLLRELKEQFGQEQLNELGEFLLDYVTQRLTEDDPDTQDLAQAQEWTALAYTQPSDAARKLAEALALRVKQQNVAEVLRLASLVETFADPLVKAGFQPLLIYSRGIGSFARDDLEEAKNQFGEVLLQRGQLKVAGVSLDIPSELFTYKEKAKDVATSSEGTEELPIQEHQGRYALVVGINQYPFLANLKNPAGDAEAIAQLLEQYGEFQVQRLPATVQDGKLQVDSEGLLETADLEEAITDLFQPKGYQIPETAVLFFAGHSVRRSVAGRTEGYLGTSDSNLRKGLRGISLRWLRDLLRRSPVRQQIVWLDCAHSGELFDFAEAAFPGSQKGRDRCFIATSDNGEWNFAYEAVNDDHGVLSGALIQWLDPTRQLDKWVTNYNLTDFVYQDLKDTFRHSNLSFINSGDQIILTGEQSFISRKSLAEAAEEIQKLLDQLSKAYPPTNAENNSIIAAKTVEVIEKEPSLKSKIVNAIKLGSTKALKELIDHPAINIILASYEGYCSAE